LGLLRFSRLWFFFRRWWSGGGRLGVQFFHPLPLQLLVVAFVWVMVFSPGGGSPAIHRPLDLPPGVIPGTGNSKIYGKVCESRFA